MCDSITSRSFGVLLAPFVLLSLVASAAAAAPTISIEDMSIRESGDLGSQSDFFVIIRLSEASTQTVTVTATTSALTATGAQTCGGVGDFLLRTATVTFSPQKQSTTVPIMTCGDDAIEPDETFKVTLSNPVNASISDAEGIITIKDDEQPRVYIQEFATVNPEGNKGTTNATLNVRLSPTSLQTVTVQYATSDSNATGGSLCIGATDYVSSSGTLTFAPGQNLKTIVLSVCADTLIDAKQEVFFVTLSNAVNAVISTTGFINPDTHPGDKGIVTIHDDDRPTVTMTPVVVNETNAGSFSAPITITLSKAMTQPLTLGYSTRDTPQDSAGIRAGASCGTNIDFVIISGASVTFNPGELTKTAHVTVCGDAVIEGDESAAISLTNPFAADVVLLSGSGTVTIANDDFPALAINNISVNTSTTAATVDAIFTVTLAPSVGAEIGQVTVSYAASNGTMTGGAACGGNVGYLAQSGTLVFGPGTTQRPITVKVCAAPPPPNLGKDGCSRQLMEAFKVTLSNPTKATLGDTAGVARICIPP